MSINSFSLLRCYFLMYVSVIYDNHQALQRVKCICVRYWTACRNGFLVLVLSHESFYIGFVACMLFWVQMGYILLLTIGIVLNIIRVCVIFVLSCFLVICAFKTFCCGLVGHVLVWCSVLVYFLHMRVVFMVLFPGFVLRCSSVAPNDVVLCLCSWE
jgi:hypothetical protein